ncbi:MAG: glycoside hydrolase family 97 N-terminal domain-containing protein, partial [Rikenellaceae bacterium]
MKRIINSMALATLLFVGATTASAAQREITLSSPDGKTQAKISVGDQIQYSLSQDGVEVLSPSELSMTLSDGEVWGVGSKLKSVSRYSEDQTIETPRYRSTHIDDKHNGVVLNFANWKLEFRAFDDAVAYRFVSTKRGEYQVMDERADFNFPNNAVATVPYVAIEGTIEEQFFNSFENTYTVSNLSDLDKNRLMFLPLSVEAQGDKRITITE